MTERDYIIATDVARLRVVLDVLRAMNDDAILPGHPIRKHDLMEAIAVVAGWRVNVERMIDTSPPPEGETP